MTPNRTCHHCLWMTAEGLFHSKDCKCSHHHADHASFGGCLIESCECDRYDQTSEAKVPKEPKEPREPKIKPVFEPIVDLVALEAQVGGTNELADAQKRLDALRAKVVSIRE